MFTPYKEPTMRKKLLPFLLACLTSAAFAAVDVNKATEAELDGIKGVGPATSKLILNERKKAEFKDWEDLMHRVKGIGEARASRLSAEGLTVGGNAYPRALTGAAVAPKGAKAHSLEGKPANQPPKATPAPDVPPASIGGAASAKP